MLRSPGVPLFFVWGFLRRLRNERTNFLDDIHGRHCTSQYDGDPFGGLDPRRTSTLIAGPI